LLSPSFSVGTPNLSSNVKNKLIIGTESYSLVPVPYFFFGLGVGVAQGSGVGACLVTGEGRGLLSTYAATSVAS
jgi:hypothetical protein